MNPITGSYFPRHSPSSPPAPGVLAKPTGEPKPSVVSTAAHVDVRTLAQSLRVPSHLRRSRSVPPVYDTSGRLHAPPGLEPSLPSVTGAWEQPSAPLPSPPAHPPRSLTNAPSPPPPPLQR